LVKKEDHGVVDESANDGAEDGAQEELNGKEFS